MKKKLRKYNIWLTKFSELISSVFPADKKEYFELLYWRFIRRWKGGFSNTHFKEFFTSFFNIEYEFYQGKKILDIGCGPNGSLEWADNSAERIGLDPLAEKYLEMGASDQKMKYVNGYSERMPFSNEYFDVVSSFNSLDHVDDVDKTFAEIYRALKPGGLFLLITDIGHKATPTEPQELTFNLLEKLEGLFIVEENKFFERANPRKIYESVRQNILYDFDNPARRYAVLTARLLKRA